MSPARASDRHSPLAPSGDAGVHRPRRPSYTLGLEVWERVTARMVELRRQAEYGMFRQKIASEAGY